MITGTDEPVPVRLTKRRARLLLTGHFAFAVAMSVMLWITFPQLAGRPEASMGSPPGLLMLLIIAITGSGLMSLSRGQLGFGPSWPRGLAATARAAMWPVRVGVALDGALLILMISGMVRTALMAFHR